MRLIDADELLKEVVGIYDGWLRPSKTWQSIEDSIRNAPTIEPNEDCPYNGMCLCAMALRFDIFALLKEQEERIKKRDESVEKAQEEIKWLRGMLKEQEEKYGYWINPTSQDCHCSECGEQPVHEPGESVPLYDLCPYCGAKMEVKWNE